jgi:hypothetical protein
MALDAILFTKKILLYSELVPQKGELFDDEIGDLLYVRHRFPARNQAEIQVVAIANDRQVKGGAVGGDRHRENMSCR